MTETPFAERDELNADQLAALRDLYAPPVDATYWDRLHDRVMARLAAPEPVREWWALYSGWQRAGLVAAGIAAIIAAGTLWRTRSTEDRMAYREWFQMDADVPVLVEVERDRSSISENTLRYLLRP